MSLCENNCTYNGYDNETKKAKCECPFKSKELIISELINKTNDLSYNFTKKEESSNIITMKCVYTLFSKNGLLKNIGSYILLFTIILFIISSILFYKCGYYLLEDDIKEIIEIKNQKNINNNYDIKETIDINYKEKKSNVYNKKKKSKIKKKKKLKKKSGISKENRIKLNLSDNSKSFSKSELKNVKNTINEAKGKKSNVLLNFNDYEFNSLSYKDAVKYDKRKFINYYISLIKVKHPFIFSFCPIKDYNSLIIKIDLFFLSFSIYCFINCLFFDEKTIHKIYLDEGTYNFKYLIPYISYSFIISHTLITVIKHFSLSERNIGEIAKQKSLDKASDKAFQVKKCIRIKYICFFCLCILFLIFFWYYLSSFGAVYQNTQIYLIKNILISFSFSLIYPFIINIFPAILRIYSLKESNEECNFKFSKIIQFI